MSCSRTSRWLPRDRSSSPGFSRNQLAPAPKARRRTAERSASLKTTVGTWGNSVTTAATRASQSPWSPPITATPNHPPAPGPRSAARRLGKSPVASVGIPPASRASRKLAWSLGSPSYRYTLSPGKRTPSARSRRAASRCRTRFFHSSRITPRRWLSSASRSSTAARRRRLSRSRAPVARSRASRRASAPAPSPPLASRASSRVSRREIRAAMGDSGSAGGSGSWPRWSRAICAATSSTIAPSRTRTSST